MNDEADLMADMRGFTDERYASQNDLAEQLGGPQRAAAGAAARDSANADIAAALGMARSAPAGNRAAITGHGGSSDWGARADAQTQPLLDARQRLLAESRGQGGLARFDRGALDTAANASIDIDRRAHEREQLSQLLALQRQKMLTALGIKYADPGPSRSQQNLATFAGLAGAAGATGDSMAAGRSSGSGGGGYDWFGDTGGVQDGYTYDPYGPRFNTGG